MAFILCQSNTMPDAANFTYGTQVDVDSKENDGLLKF